MTDKQWGDYGKYYASTINSVPKFFSDLVAQMLVDNMEKREDSVVFLDVAAGPGTLTRSILEQLQRKQQVLPRGSQFHVTDYAEGMVDTAKGFLSSQDVVQYGIDSLLCYTLNGCDPTLQGSIGKVTHLGCMFGIMFFPERLLGLQRLRELMAPNGKAIFGTWRDPDSLPFCFSFCEALATTEEHRQFLASYVDDLPCRNAKDLQGEFQSAGYHHVEIQEIDQVFLLDKGEGLFMGMIANPVFLEKFPILKQFTRDDLLMKWNEYLTPHHAFGQRWLSPENPNQIVLRFVANIVHCQA